MTILVVGATGALGLRVAERLRRAGQNVLATWRSDRPDMVARLEKMGCETQRLDLADTHAAAQAMAQCEAAVLSPILTLSGPAVCALGSGVGTRLILFSSNNVLIDPDTPVYEALRREEAALAATPQPHVLLRPTMIYGHPDDGNLARLIGAARRWPVLPLPGSGRALQQPIHIDDLADLAAKLAMSPFSDKAIYSVAGPDVVTARGLYQAVRDAAGSRTPIVQLPKKLVHLAGRALALLLRRKFPVDGRQLARIERDKTPPENSAPPDWAPKIGLRKGLKRLAADLGA